MRTRSACRRLLPAALALFACSSNNNNGGFLGGSGGASAAGSGGSMGGGTGGSAPAGSGGNVVAGSGGSVVTGSGGNVVAGSGGAGGRAAGSGGAGGRAAGAGGAGGAGGSGGAVAMSAGCGMATTQMIGKYVRLTLTVAGQPAASMNRLYYVRLPAGYSPSKPYRVIYLGPGCGPAQDIQSTPKALPLDTDPASAGAATDAILVQMEPGFYNKAEYSSASCVPGAPADAGTNACAYCFDDWAYLTSIPDGVGGMVAIERAYFDALHKAVEASYCVDTGRQFYAGYSSGGWMAQQLGCWFPDVLRAQGSVTGGLPPPIKTNVSGANDYCSKRPIAAFLIHDYLDMSNTFPGSVDAARRLFAVNGCTGTFQAPPSPETDQTLPAGLAPYTIAGITNSNVFRCYQYTTCPAASPIVFCVSNDSMHNDQHARADPGFWQFFSKM